ncbi:MAG: glutamine--fructose-6-phosphate transaminase (isomerizing) [Betaproteobacteria bacterium]
MCGIVAAVSRRNVVPILIEGLRRLEYRGYDSAGVAVINGRLERIRSCGRVAQLEKLAAASGLAGHIGIGHTRWATHGAPSERNAHPHVSGGVSVVHNGIIENHEAVRARLLASGYEFSSDTDTEVIAHLIHSFLKEGTSLLEGVRAATSELRGAYAIAVIAAEDPQRIAVARMGAPLALGLGEGENFAASDTGALLQVTRRIVYLEEGDCAEVTLQSARVVDARGRIVERPLHLSELRADALELGSWRHYMQKEIFEQPAAVAATLETAGSANPAVFGPEAEKVLQEASSVLVLACGTSYHAGLVARHWIEGLAGIRCAVEIASEYRYRDSVPDPRALVIAVSQSGETADTIAAVQHAQRLGQERTLAICNVAESSLIRNCFLRFLTRAGPEIGVASTKAFTCQLAALLALAVSLGRVKGRISPAKETELRQALLRLPAALSVALRAEPQMAAWARELAAREHALFLGRGVHYPIAMEGALKLKEISYIHAEAYAAGELKHGPLALVDRDMPVIAIAPRDALLDKLKSNIEEVRSRGGELYVLEAQAMGEAPAILSPALAAVPLQLLAYHAALIRGNDVDKPRNLAKSVTVE